MPLLKSCHSGDFILKKLHSQVKYRGRPLGSYPFGKLLSNDSGKLANAQPLFPYFSSSFLL
jgi:hypothetical protein